MPAPSNLLYSSKTLNAPPDWEKIPFDVACSRCGHDLRGQTESTCPSCELTIDWDALVPIEKLTCSQCGYHLYGLKETRCPECGTSFTWREALANFKYRGTTLFEYQWRFKPIRSIFSTWSLALRPAKLWRTVDMNDPPYITGLIIHAVVSFILFSVGTGSVVALFRWLKYLRPTWDQSGFFGALRYLGYQLEYTLSARYWFTVVIPAFVWCISIAIALMVFRQSMRRFRIRTLQVMRVWTYSTPVVLPTLVLLLSAASLWEASVHSPILQAVIRVLPVLFFLCVVTYTLGSGYQLYLRMDRALAVASVSIAMGTLAAMVICNVLIADSFSAWFIRDVLIALEIWKDMP